jgi:hypothetical protein
MNIKFLTLILCSVLIGAATARAEEDLFKRNNPDIFKYEFASSFIISMSYLEKVDERWKKADKVKTENDEAGFIQWNLDRLSRDNMDLRVAKNYLVKYFNVGNPLIRKVVDSYAFSCDQLIELNRRERDLWSRMHPDNNEGASPDETKAKEFLDEQASMALDRKSVMQNFVETSILMTKVLLSEDTKEKQVRKRLALTTNQRDRLIKKLDAFAGENLDWGMQPGQTFLEGAEANIREVLEDPAYQSADE